MTLKAKYLDWEIEIFDDENQKFYGIASKGNTTVMSKMQPTIRQALADTQEMIRRVWSV